MREKTYAWKWLFSVVKSSDRVDLPSTDFCNDWLLGGKYAVCQEILTKKRVFGQETLTKKPFNKKNASNYGAV
jgi:hypothetical protein